MLALMSAGAPGELLFLGKCFILILLILFAVLWSIGPEPKKGR